MANELMKLGKVYLSNYERQYDVLKGTDYFSQDDWTQNAQKGRLNEYIALLSQQSKLPSSFYNDYKIGYLDNDGRFYSMYNELYGDRENVTERFEDYTDEYGTKQKKSLGKMSDYDYNKYLLNQQADIKIQDLNQKVLQEIKDNNQGWIWLNDLVQYPWYMARRLASGVGRFVDDITNLMGALIDGTTAAMNGGSFSDTFMQIAKDRTYTLFGTGTEDRDLFAQLEESVLDFERYYTNIRNLDGSYSTMGSILGSVADSVGYMLPTILLSAGVGAAASGAAQGGTLLSGASTVGAASVGTTAASTVGKVSRFIFYAGQFSGTVSENAKNTSLESVGSWAKISNAALSTALEAGVETVLGKIWDSSVLDNLHYNTTGKVGTALSGKSLTYIKGKPQINGLLRITKGAVQEGIEEVLQDVSTYFVNLAYSVIDEHFYQDYTFEDAMNSFVVSLISSAMMTGADVMRTRRYDTGEAQVTKEGNLVYDRKGDIKTKKWSKLKTWTVNADMGSFMNTYQEIMTGKMSPEERNAAVMKLYAGYRTMGQLYSYMGSEKFEKACKFLDEVIEKSKTGDYVDVVSRIREDFKTNDKEVRIAKAERNLVYAQNRADISNRNAYMEYSQNNAIRYGSQMNFDDYLRTYPNDVQEAKTQLDNAKTELRNAQSYDVIMRPRMLFGQSFDKKASQRQQAYMSGEALTYIDQYCKEIATYIHQSLSNLQLSQRKYFAERARDAGIKTVVNEYTRELIEKGEGEETARTKASEYEEAIRQIFNFDKNVERVIVTGEGNNTVVIDKTLFVPIQMIRNSDGSVVLSSKAENQIVDTIILNKSSSPYFQALVSLYRELSGVAEASEIEAVYNMLYNSSFFYMALYTSHERSVELLAEIANFVTQQSKRKESSVYDALYLKKLKEISQGMKEQLITYAINQQEFNVNNYDFLTTDEKKSISQKRWGKELGNKIIRGEKLSDSELKIVSNRINSLPTTQEQKDKILNGIISIVRENRLSALRTLNDYYKGVFLSLYDDKTYLVPSTKGSVAFNSFLQNMGLTIKTIGNIPAQDTDVYKAIADKYKNVDRKSTLSYYSKLFSQSTAGEYTFHITNDRVIIESKKQAKALGFDKAYYQRSSITNLSEDTFKTFVYPIVENVNKLVGKISKPGTSSLITIDDIINEPNKFLKDSVYNEILKKYGNVTSENVFIYLNGLYAKDMITIIQLRNGEYKYASLDNIKDIVKNDFTLVDNLGKEISIKGVVNEKYLSGELRNTKIVISNDTETTRYNPLNNTIYISQYDIDNANGRPLNFIIAHEFQHAVQYFNGISLGISYNFLTGNAITKSMRDDIVSDIMRHKPDLFSEKGIADKNIEIAQQYLYYSSGEAMAYGLQGTDLFDFQPTVIGFTDDSLTIQFPWGSKYNLKRNNFSEMSLRPIGEYFDLSETVVKNTLNEHSNGDPTYHDYIQNTLGEYAEVSGYESKMTSLMKDLPDYNSTELVDKNRMIGFLNQKSHGKVIFMDDIQYKVFCNLFGSELNFQRALKETLELYNKIAPTYINDKKAIYKDIYDANTSNNRHTIERNRRAEGELSARTLIERNPQFVRDSMRLLNLMYFPTVSFDKFMKGKIAFYRVGRTHKTTNLYSAFVLLPGIKDYITVWAGPDLNMGSSASTFVGKVGVSKLLGYFPLEHEIAFKPDVIADVSKRGFEREAGDTYFEISYDKNDNAYLSVLSPILDYNDPLYDVESYDTAGGVTDDMLSSDIAPVDREKFHKKYLSKKFVQNTNLEPFVTGNRDYQKYMPAELQQFVYSTTGLDLHAEFPNEIATKIENGTLVTNDVMYYFMKGDAIKNHYFFELVNDAFFQNKYIESAAQLANLMNNYSTEMYAASMILKLLQNDPKYKNLIPADILDKLDTHVNGVKYFDKVKQFILSLDDNIKQKYYQYVSYGSGIQGRTYSPDGNIVESGTDRRALTYTQVRPWVRYVYMKYYDGTLASIERIVKLVRYAMLTKRGVKKDAMDVITDDSINKRTTKKGSGAGENFDVNAIENVGDDVSAYSEDAALSAIVEDMDENEARKTILMHKAEELVEQYKKEKWSDIVFNKKYRAMLHEVDNMFETDFEGAMKLAAAYELTNVNITKKVNALRKEVVATNIAKASEFRGRGNVLRNTKRIAAWIRNNTSKVEMVRIREKYPNVFEEDGYLRKDTFQKEKTENGVTQKITVPTEEILKTEAILKEIRTGVRNKAFESKASMEIGDKLKKQKVKFANMKAKYERKIAKLQQQIQDRYGVAVAISGSDKFAFDENSTMPSALVKLLDTEFDRLAPTLVQTISNMNDKQITVSLTEFLDKNTDVLATLEDADLIDIVHFYTSTQLMSGIGTELAQKKYAIAEMSILTYILQTQREGKRALPDADIKAIENLLYGLANNSANILASWRDALKRLKPEERIVSNIAKAEGVLLDDEQVTRVVDAVRTKNADEIDKIVKDLYQEVYEKQLKFMEDKGLPPKSKFDKFLDRIVAFQQTAMLSSPGTWIRNKVSNPIVSAANKASEVLGNLFDKAVGKLFPKKKQFESQYKLVGTKVSTKTQNFIKENVLDTGMLALIDDGISKYDARKGTVRGADISGADVMSEMILHKIARDVFNNTSNPFEGKNKLSKAFLATQKFIQKMLTDVPYIHKATVRYFGKMLTEDNVDLSKGMTKDVMDTLATAYTYAAMDYMHKSNVFTEIERAIYNKTGSKGRFILKQVFPFMSASWNWFVKGLEYTPVGLTNSIVQYCRLEKTIAKAELDYRQGKTINNPRMTEYLVKRKIGSGILGTIGLGIGILLGALGVASIDKDDDDKIKLKVGDVYVDISQLFAFSTLTLGMALTNPRDGKWTDVALDTLDIMFDDFLVNDIINDLRYTDTVGEWLLKQPENALSKLIPNALKTFNSVIQVNKIKYDSGILGSLERLAGQAFPGLTYAFPKRIDIYTGEVQSKYAIPFAVDLFNKMSPLKISYYKVSDLEKTAMGLGLLDSELTGKYKDNVGALSTKEKSVLNQKYGQLNKKYLTEFVNNKTKRSVKMPDGTFKELYYKQMTDDQRAYAFKGIKSENAKLAKIYVATTLKGMKYYGTKTEYQRLKENKITKNVFIKTKTTEGFY